MPLELSEKTAVLGASYQAALYFVPLNCDSGLVQNGEMSDNFLIGFRGDENVVAMMYPPVGEVTRIVEFLLGQLVIVARLG